MAAELVEGRRRSAHPAWVSAFVREFFVVGVALALYVAVRAIIALHTGRAYANAHELIRFERAIGLFHEPAMQRWLEGIGWLDQIFDEIYIFGLWPVVIATLIWLLRCHRRQYFVYRNALLLSGAIGLVIFLLYPVAPPRFLPGYGFVDTVTLHTHAYRLTEPPSVTNMYAAMPSLHVGWNLLMSIAIVRHARRWSIRASAVAMPLVLYASTVVTANHLLIDGIAGSAIAISGLVLAHALATGWFDRRHARAAEQCGDEDGEKDQAMTFPVSGGGKPR